MSYILSGLNSNIARTTFSTRKHIISKNKHCCFQIPFSKFILGSKGRVQDKQNRMRLDRVTHFGISCGDKIEGPFDLEIEYIGKINEHQVPTYTNRGKYNET